MTTQFLFFDDYSEGAHPKILAALGATHLDQDRGYGADAITAEAVTHIRRQTRQADADVYFVATGTQANIVSLASMLKPFESVIAEYNGHIHVHETGAIEATGHKVNCVAGQHGKLNPANVQKVLDSHAGDQQMVKPRAVYISQPTELGTLYSLDELKELHSFCKNHDLYLYLDGARLGQALASTAADFTLPDIAAHCDMFYIGGTKNGGLLGEAIVITNPALKSDFAYHLRQRGALLSKARSVSSQFLVFFRDNLYMENATHANQLAQLLGDGLKKLGITFMAPTATNQLFPVLPNELITQLKTRYGFHVWCKADGQEGKSVVRLVTSWSTPETAVQEFLSYVTSVVTARAE